MTINTEVSKKKAKKDSGLGIGVVIAAAGLGLLLLSKKGQASEEWKTLTCDFNTWQNWTSGRGSCQINGNNLPVPDKSFFIVPLPSDVPRICGGNMVVTAIPYTMHGYKFMGIFNGTNAGAAAGGSNLQVWLAHNIVNWTGPEIGFYFNFNTGTITGYADMGPPINRFWTVNLDMSPDRLEHEYKAEVDANKHDLIHFYIDDIIVGSIDASGVDFYNQTYYYAASTGNNYGTWDYDNYSLKMGIPQYH